LSIFKTASEGKDQVTFDQAASLELKNSWQTTLIILMMITLFIIIPFRTE
jgi:hypothetical protein